MKKKRLVNMLIKFLMVVVSCVAILMILIGLFMISNGSFEAFPTAEQIEKMKTVGILIFVVGLIIESIVLLLLHRKSKNK